MHIIILGAALIFILLLMYFSQPLFLRRSFISSTVGFDIPKTAQIVEYRFGVNSFGVAPFFAKLELSQEDYVFLIGQSPTNVEHLGIFRFMKQSFSYYSLDVGDIVEIRHKERMTSKTSFFLFSATRTINILIIETIDGEYFLYVFYL